MNPPLVTLHVWRIAPAAIPRALTRMAVDRRRLRATAGVRFSKLLGTGTGDGFGPTDADPTRWAAVVVWADPARAADFPQTPVGRAWQRITLSEVRLDLHPLSSRGRWARQEPFSTPGDPTPGHGAPDDTSPSHGGRGHRTRVGDHPAGASSGPVLALTRARLRPHRALTFWRAVPPVAAALRTAPGLLARFGIGEAPLGWQGTVSVWRRNTDLVNFAYRHPQHRAVIDRTPVTRWYAEELFARFAIQRVTGDRTVLGWNGDHGE